MHLNIEPELKSRKQIAFDLKQDLLKKYYPKPKVNLNSQYYKKAYGDLKEFFKNENWEHRQGSVYTSRDILTYYDVAKLMEKIAKDMPWLSDCVDTIDVTNVGEYHSLKQTLEAATKVLANAD